MCFSWVPPKNVRAVHDRLPQNLHQLSLTNHRDRNKPQKGIFDASTEKWMRTIWGSSLVRGRPSNQRGLHWTEIESLWILVGLSVADQLSACWAMPSPTFCPPRELINIYSGRHKCRNVCLSGSWGRSTRVCLIQGFPNSIRLSRSLQLSSTVRRYYTANVLCTCNVKFVNKFPEGLSPAM